MESELRRIAEQSRKQRLNGPAHDETEFPLIGYCFENAFVLASCLQNEGYDAQIVVGTTERVADELLQAGYDIDSFTSVDDLGGLTHYWVEVGGYTIDIAAESHDALGEILVSSSRPESYYVFEDSYTVGEKTAKNANRCEYCGGSGCLH